MKNVNEKESQELSLSLEFEKIYCDNSSYWDFGGMAEDVPYTGITMTSSVLL